MPGVEFVPPRQAVSWSTPCAAGIQFLLNGEFHVMENPDPSMLLSDYIRNVAGLKGTKISCAQGGCGACTVVMSSINDSTNGNALSSGDVPEGLAYRPINSCLRPLCSVDGMSITTVEGVGSKAKGLHEIQKKLAKHNGSQCGFCTPGFVMSMYGLIKEKPEPTAQEIEDQFDGNICRCTGYRPILDAFQEFSCGASCRSAASPCSAEIEDLCMRTKKSCAKTQQPMHASPRQPTLVSAKDGVTWVKLHSLDTLLSLLADNPGQVRMVVGNTASGVYEPEPAPILADISQIAELRTVHVDSSGVRVGGAVPMADLMRTLEANKEMSPSYEPLVKHMYRVGNHQVRNVGSVSGNLVLTHTHPEFVSDMATILMAAGVQISVARAGEKGEGRNSVVGLGEFFRLSRDGLVITSIKLPALPPSAKFVTQKVALRRVNAHAFVNMGMGCDVDAETGVFKEAPTIVYGGVKDQPQRAFQTEAFLAGKSFMDEKVLQHALGLLSRELVPDPKFGRTQYRAALLPAFLFKAVLRLWPADKLPPELRSAAREYDRPITSGEISFDEGDPSIYPVTQPISKLSEEIQTTGEAVYVDDVDFANQLHAVLVMSSFGNAAIDRVDGSAALQAPGVKAFLSAETLNKEGYCNVISEWEDLFASKRSSYCGQAVGLVVAETKRQAEVAAQLVAVEYSDIQKPILSCQEALAVGSLFPETKAVLKQGDAANAMANGAVVIQGSTTIGHQYHFHLETQRAVCVPGEDGALHVFSSSQNPSQVQAVVATAVNAPQHKVKVTVKRIGGAYGAKINRATPVAAACALAAAKVRRPVRLVLDLSTNMQNVGARSPYECTYQVSATKEGKVTGIQMRILNDQGAHFDLDPPTTDGFLLFLDNVYQCPNWDVEIMCARTNLPACTYMRGPAFVEAVFMIETMLEHVATALRLPPDQVRELNMYHRGDVSPTGQHLNYCNARYIFNELRTSCDYYERMKRVAEFNAGSLYVKRGLSLVPIRFGLFWEGSSFRALVNVFPDGSVTILQSGTEVGQGLFVKVAQVAAMELGKAARGGCPMEHIRVGSVDTDVANHVASTGGSITSELCAQATQEACKALVARLLVVGRQLASRNGVQPSWEELIEAAADAGVDLQARGRSLPGASPTGTFQYMSYGAGVTEAEVDILTGDTRLLRADLLLDCGKSLNPAIDIGQTQGAYIMGVGYFLSEEFIYDETSMSGKLLSDSTWEYKPPSHKDIPHDFRTALLQNSGNPAGFLRSKASGEPPYAMACSALLAVRQAVEAGWAQRGDSGWVPLSSPATIDKVALAADVPVTLLHV